MMKLTKYQESKACEARMMSSIHQGISYYVMAKAGMKAVACSEMFFRDRVAMGWHPVYKAMNGKGDVVYDD